MSIKHLITHLNKFTKGLDTSINWAKEAENLLDKLEDTQSLNGYEDILDELQEKLSLYSPSGGDHLIDELEMKAFIKRVLDSFELKIVTDAKQLINNRLKIAPEFVLYQSIDNQLDYLLELLQGSNLDRSKLKKINLGRYAAYEFEQSDSQLADELMEVQSIVNKMIGGVRS